MIIKVDKDSIKNIKNKQIKAEAKRYLDMYDGFLKDIEDTGVKISESNSYIHRNEYLNRLLKKGASLENNENSLFVNNISKACVDCRKADHTVTYILSLNCNRDCYFCANKNQYNYDFDKDKINDVLAEFKKYIQKYKKANSVALTGGEPLLYKDKVYEFFGYVKSVSKNMHTRLYTNGDFIDDEVASKLAKTGLDEIRFGIKLDNNKIDETILDRIKIAKKYIKDIMVEMPVIPNTLEVMKELLIKLNTIGIKGINLLEYLYSFKEPEGYKKEGLTVSDRPYKILNNYNYAGGLPIHGSDEEALKLVEFAIDEKLKIGVHYCNIENKLTAQLYHENRSIKLSDREVFSQNDFTIKSIRGYGKNDITVIKKILDDNKIKYYLYNEADEFIEFSPKHLPLLSDLDIEVSLSSLVRDYDDEGRSVLREVKIDLVKTKGFTDKELVTI